MFLHAAAAKPLLGRQWSAEGCSMPQPANQLNADVQATCGHMQCLQSAAEAVPGTGIALGSITYAIDTKQHTLEAASVPSKEQPAAADKPSRHSSLE